MHRAAMLLVASTLVAAAVDIAQSKPNFSGIWLPVSPPEAAAQGAEFHIKQDASSITLGHPEGAHGPAHNPTYKLDGVEARQPNLVHPSETDVTRAFWDGDRLVIVVRPEHGGPAHKRVLWLQPDGTLAMEITVSIAGQPEEVIKATFKKK